MDIGKVATRYARAIYGYAAESKAEEALYQQMKMLIDSYAQLPDLRRVMSNPTVSGEKKKKLLTTACGAVDDPFLEKVISLIVTKGRAEYMENIAMLYERFYRQAKGVVYARLITVDPVSEEVKEGLKTILKKITDHEIEFISTEDPDIIGGFVLEIEDNRLDASVKDQLHQLRLDLTNN